MRTKNPAAGHPIVKQFIVGYLPELLVLLLCAALLCVGISMKKGYHQDELLSFELANAEFNPWIVPTQPQGRLAKFVENELRGETFGETFGNLMDTVWDVLANRGSSKLLSYTADVYEEPVWIDREQFLEYITVNRKDAFNYLSVYFNVKDDNHPPLYFMALHTVSSIFREQIHPAMGCAVNLVCVLGCMALLMVLGRWVMKLLGMEEQGRAAGLLAALLYGLSTGAMATTLLIRMYGMLTLWCTALLALHIKKLYGIGSADFRRHNKLLILVTVLGFLTQYFFLFYCLILAAVTAAALWRQKRGRELFCYVRAMVAAAVIGVGIFPFSIADVFSSGRGVEALNNLSAGIAGYGERLAAFGKIILDRTGSGSPLFDLSVLGVLLAVTLPRLAMYKGKAGISLKRSLWAVLLMPLAGYFLLAARMSPYLVDRYVMPLFPLAIFAGVTVVVCLLKLAGEGKENPVIWKLLKGTVAALLVTGQLFGMITYDGSYLYSGYEAQEKIARQYAGTPCICVHEGVTYYENLVEFTQYERALLVTPRTLEERKDVESIRGLDQVVVIIKSPEVDEQEVCTVLKEQYHLTLEKTLWRTRNYEDDVVLLFAGE